MRRAAEGGFRPDALFEILARHRVRFVLFGALGAIAHGAQLTTLDADICPAIDAEDLGRLAAALDELDARPVASNEPLPEGFTTWSAADRRWQTFDHAMATRFGQLDVQPFPYGPNGTADRFDYGQLAPRAVRKEIFGSRVLVASIEDVIDSKMSRRRPKNLAAWPELERLLREAQVAT